MAGPWHELAARDRVRAGRSHDASATRTRSPAGPPRRCAGAACEAVGVDRPRRRAGRGRTPRPSRRGSWSSWSASCRRCSTDAVTLLLGLREAGFAIATASASRNAGPPAGRGAAPGRTARCATCSTPTSRASTCPASPTRRMFLEAARRLGQRSGGVPGRRGRAGRRRGRAPRRHGRASPSIAAAMPTALRASGAGRRARPSRCVARGRAARAARSAFVSAAGPPAQRAVRLRSPSITPPAEGGAVAFGACARAGRAAAGLPAAACGGGAGAGRRAGQLGQRAHLGDVDDAVVLAEQALLAGGLVVERVQRRDAVLRRAEQQHVVADAHQVQVAVRADRGRRQHRDDAVAAAAARAGHAAAVRALEDPPDGEDDADDREQAEQHAQAAAGSAAGGELRGRRRGRRWSCRGSAAPRR